MEIIIYSLPFLIAFILLIFFKRYIVWWEYIILIGISILCTLGIKALMIYGRECDTEYLGGYITKITHYDEWDEWVEQTCTREVPDGTDENGNTTYRTETYDCSYRDYHPEKWMYTDDKGREEYFYNKEEFNRAMRELGYPKKVFRDMHRDYYRIDGDAQDYFYDGSIEHIRALTWSHTYQNKIIASNSIFKFEDIDESEAKKLGLFKYPKVIEQDQDVVLGVNLGRGTHKRFKYINATYGKKKQFRLYVLIFTDKPLDVSEKQKSYWQGGNKNEFVLCLGYNSKTGRIDWCNPFSWCDAPKLEVATKDFFRSHPYLATSMDDYASWLMKNLHLWKRKEFKDFDYIENTLTKGQAIALFIVMLIIDIILSICLIGNGVDNEEMYDDSFFYSFKNKQRKITSFIIETFNRIRKWIESSITFVLKKGQEKVILIKRLVFSLATLLKT